MFYENEIFCNYYAIEMPESKLFNEIKKLPTEQRNPNSENIDSASVREILEIINDQDALVPIAVKKEIPFIEKAVKIVVKSFKKGGRLIYVGAGTSGRLGIVDASECPPTFGSDPELVQGIIAGGKDAVFRAQEGAEDRPELGAKEILKMNISSKDTVCGIAASGRTPFVKGALEQAYKSGAGTILISTVSRAKIKEIGVIADIAICPDVGPEVITGSTRMKSGTAQKLVLNMITTAAMVKMGKTLGNVMVDLQLTNEKLKERSKNILMTITGIDYDTAENYLNEASGHVKTALVMILAGASRIEALESLRKADGFVRKAIEFAKK